MHPVLYAPETYLSQLVARCTAKDILITPIAVAAQESPCLKNLQGGHNALWCMPHNIAQAQASAAEASQLGLAYTEIAVAPSLFSTQQGFFLIVAGEPEDLSRSQSILDALAPCPSGWWHVGEAGAVAFVLSILQTIWPDGLQIIPGPDFLARLQMKLQQQQGILAQAQAYLAESRPHFRAFFPERQRALAFALDPEQSPARQLAQLICQVCPT